LTYIVILLVAGVLLAFLETFIPSGGILSVLAGVALVAAVVLGFGQSGTVGSIVLIAELVCVPVFVVVGLKMLPRTLGGRKMMLGGPGKDFADSRGKAGVSDEDYSYLVGKTGIVAGTLRPSGIAEIEGRRYSVAAQGERIDQGCEITVIKVEGNDIIVEPKDRSLKG
jgi:membrane-bound serine protease (ClpP class)